MARPPSQWPYAQHDFHETYDRDNAPFPRTPVWWRVEERPVLAVVDDLDGLHVWLSGRHKWRTGSLCAVWPVDAPEGTEPSLVFEVEFHHRDVEGPGTLVGEFEMNGALCVEADHGRVFWPTYNPRPPGRLRIQR